MLPDAKKINIKDPNLSPVNEKLVDAVYANIEKRMAEEKASPTKVPAKK